MILTIMSYCIDQCGKWLRGVRIIRSPNRSQRKDEADVDLLVIHGISLPPGQYGGDYIDRLFTNTLDPVGHPYFAKIAGLRVSAHLLINRQGDVTQYVPFSDCAWHAGVSSFAGREHCNKYSMSIELEGCDEEAYSDEQYSTLAAVTDVICRRWPKITQDRIVGHCDIAPDRKTDPGPAFDKEYYFSLVGI